MPSSFALKHFPQILPLPEGCWHCVCQMMEAKTKKSWGYHKPIHGGCGSTTAMPRRKQRPTCLILDLQSPNPTWKCWDWNPSCSIQNIGEGPLNCSSPTQKGSPLCSSPYETCNEPWARKSSDALATAPGTVQVLVGTLMCSVPVTKPFPRKSPLEACRTITLYCSSNAFVF